MMEVSINQGFPTRREGYESTFNPHRERTTLIIKMEEHRMFATISLPRGSKTPPEYTAARLVDHLVRQFKEELSKGVAEALKPHGLKLPGWEG